MNNDVKYINEFVVKYNEFKNEIRKVIVGQDLVIQQILSKIKNQIMILQTRKLKILSMS